MISWSSFCFVHFFSSLSFIQQRLPNLSKKGRGILDGIQPHCYWIGGRNTKMGSKGYRSGESTHLPPMWHRIDTICGLSLLLVLSFALRGFSPGTPVFTSPQKLTFPNCNLIRNRVDKEPLCGCATSKSLLLLFIYLFFNFKKPTLLNSSQIEN